MHPLRIVTTYHHRSFRHPEYWYFLFPEILPCVLRMAWIHEEVPGCNDFSALSFQAAPFPAEEIRFVSRQIAPHSLPPQAIVVLSYGSETRLRAISPGPAQKGRRRDVPSTDRRFDHGPSRIGPHLNPKFHYFGPFTFFIYLFSPKICIVRFLPSPQPYFRCGGPHRRKNDYERIISKCLRPHARPSRKADLADVDRGRHSQSEDEEKGGTEMPDTGLMNGSPRIESCANTSSGRTAITRLACKEINLSDPVPRTWCRRRDRPFEGMQSHPGAGSLAPVLEDCLDVSRQAPLFCREPSH